MLQSIISPKIAEVYGSVLSLEEVGLKLTQ
jgi:hypothetical protein